MENSSRHAENVRLWESGAITDHGDVNEGVKSSSGPLVRVGAIQADDAEQHGDPVVVHVEEKKLAL
jgi:hypothetical protein